MDPQTVVATTWWLVIGCATFFFSWLVGWLSYVEIRKKQLMFEERRVAIENGMPPPPLPPKQLDGWPGVKQREFELKAEERRLRIEKGLPVPEETSKPTTRSDYVRRGLLGTCLGAGLALAYVGLSAARLHIDADALAWCLGLAPIVFLYGIANLIYQRYAPDPPVPDPVAKDRVGAA
jgi:hypothetical protein